VQPKSLGAAPEAEPEKLSAPAQAMVATEAEAASAPLALKTRSAPGVNRLIIQCEEEAWIEVKDSKERMLISSLNPAGAERVVRSRGPLTLVIGNAEHVRVLHNDQPVDLQPFTKTGIARFTLP
jgi:cytoskeleton protein RodZ